MNSLKSVFLYRTSSHRNTLAAVGDFIEANTQARCYFYDSLQDLERDLSSFFIPDLAIISAPKNQGACRTICEFISEQPHLNATPSIAITDRNDQKTQMELLDIGVSDFFEIDSPLELLLATINVLLCQNDAKKRRDQFFYNKSILTSCLKNEIKSVASTTCTSLDFIKLKNKKAGHSSANDSPPGNTVVKEDLHIEFEKLVHRLSCLDELLRSVSLFTLNKIDDLVAESFEFREVLKGLTLPVEITTPHKTSAVYTTASLMTIALKQMMIFLAEELKINEITMTQEHSCQPHSNLDNPFITTKFQFNYFSLEPSENILITSKGQLKSRLSSTDLIMPFIRQITETSGGYMWIEKNEIKSTTTINLDFRAYL